MARNLTDAQRIDWLQLARSGGIGPVTFLKLLRKFGTAGRALDALPGIVARAGNAERWRICPRANAEEEYDRHARIGAVLLAHADPDYPETLRNIDDPPPLISVRGDVGLLSRSAVGIVGARNASANGRNLAALMAGALAGHGLVVVSGLARGIDGAAHAGALEADGPTVAVIASGVDVAYPPEHAELMERIADEGAVVSERPLGTSPQARHFPRRNRIIAGLSAGIVVVEAAPNSGSLITARLAAEQGREVMAVPGSPLDPRHRGTNRLLRDGATLVESADDVVRALGPMAALSPAPKAGRSRPATRQRPARPPSQHTQEPVRADGLVSHIRELLGSEPLLVDDLIRGCSTSAAAVQEALLELEILGQLERHPGNRVSLLRA